MLAQLVGGLTPCSDDQLGGSRLDYPWRALCRPPPERREAAIRSMLLQRCLFDQQGLYPCTGVTSNGHCSPVQGPQPSSGPGL